VEEVKEVLKDDRMKTNQNLKDLDREEIYIAPKFYDCFDFKTYSKELMIFRI